VLSALGCVVLLPLLGGAMPTHWPGGGVLGGDYLFRVLWLYRGDVVLFPSDSAHFTGGGIADYFAHTDDCGGVGGVA
jgi:hypothetical protein